MSLETYSIVLSLAGMLLALCTVGVVVLYLFSRRARAYLKKQDYWLYIQISGLIALMSTMGALIYQFVYLTPVCEYCWWQRIFMFPIVVVALISLWKKIKGNEVIMGSLALVGLFFALFHYYFHYQVIVLGNALSMPCTTVGILPSCTESPVLIFGFITIPLMAVVAFVALIVVSYLAYRLPSATDNNNRN